MSHRWTGKGAEEKNKELFKCIAQDVEVINLPCVVVGDFNAHIDTLDDATDRAGQRLLDWVNATGLVIANTTEKCKGRTTWAVGNKSSCIDYCILSPELFDELDSMEIDESGEKSLGSDHNRIKLVFGKAQRREKATKRPTGQQHISAREIETLVERMEEDAVKANIKDYEDFVQWINKHIRALGQRRKIA